MPALEFTLAHGSILVMALMPIVCAGIAKSGMMSRPRREGGYDNHNPRTWLGQQGDWRARANHAQANTFEALPFFFAAVIVAHQLQAPQAWLNALAVTFVLLRAAYVYCYLADKASLRSAVWALALLANICILLLPLR